MKYIAVLFIVWQAAQSATIPDEVWRNICKKNDPEYGKCLMAQFDSSRLFASKGIPELGIPPLDPFELPELIVNQTFTDIARVYAVLTNIKVVGGSNSIIEDLKVDPNKYTGEVRATVPLVDVDSDYDIDGEFANIPFKNKGHFHGTFKNIQAYIKMSLKLYEKNGEKYFKVNKLYTKITPGAGKINIVSEDKEMQQLVDFAVHFFNNNPHIVLDMLNPLFVDTANDIFREIWDTFLGAVPASVLLPE